MKKYQEDIFNDLVEARNALMRANARINNTDPEQELKEEFDQIVVKITGIMPNLLNGYYEQ